MYYVFIILGEANLFEEALQKYGKDFADIQKDFVSDYTNVDLFCLVCLFFCLHSTK